MKGASLRRDDVLRGARFGQHEVVRLIGHGATSSVFEGRHVTLGRAVALKILHDHLADDPQLAGRFVRESASLSSVGQSATRTREREG